MGLPHACSVGSCVRPECDGPPRRAGSSLVDPQKVKHDRGDPIERWDRGWESRQGSTTFGDCPRPIHTLARTRTHKHAGFAFWLESIAFTTACIHDSGEEKSLKNLKPLLCRSCASWSHPFVVFPRLVLCADDPRIRPWYVAASSGPKDVVIVLDVSGSMSQYGRLDLAKEAAETVINTLCVCLLLSPLLVASTTLIGWPVDDRLADGWASAVAVISVAAVCVRMSHFCEKLFRTLLSALAHGL